MAQNTSRRSAMLEIRLEPELKAELIQLASSENRSISEVVRRLIRQGLAAPGEHPASARKAHSMSADGQGDASPSAQATVARPG